MLVTIVCEYCGDTIEYDKRGPKVRRICFSDDCIKERARDLLFCSRQRLGAPVEKFRRRDIFERDNWVCYLCGQPTNREVPAVHALAPVIEHVHSMWVGHTKENCRTAHSVCNLRKGRRFYDKALAALVIVPEGSFVIRELDLTIPFVVGERVRCPDCGARVLKSPSGFLSVGAAPHGSIAAPCPDDRPPNVIRRCW